MKKNSLSVIIPVYNSSDTIKACLTSLNNQTLQPLEIILVDDGSTDDSQLVVKKTQLIISNLKLFSQTHQGPARARNFGASKAKGKILIFVDADMEFDQGFLEQLTLPVRKKIANGSWSGNELVRNWHNVWARCSNYNQNRSTSKMITQYKGQRKVFRSILKSEFDKVSGFDQIGYTDDWTLVSKLGYQPKITRAKFYHHNPDTLKKVYQKSLWIGKRQYKFGKFGSLIAILRANPISSLMIGLYKSIRFLELRFIIFKLVYDFGILIGATNSLTGKRY